MVLAAVAGTAQTKRQLVESHIESAELVGAGGFGTHHGTTCDDGDLNALGGVGLARIALVGQHNLDTLRIRGDSGHTIHLAFDNVTEPLLDLRMTSGNDDFHVDLPIDSSGVNRYIRTNQLHRCWVVIIVSIRLVICWKTPRTKQKFFYALLSTILLL